MESNLNNLSLAERRANALKKLEKLRMKRREEPRTKRQRSNPIPVPPTPPPREVNLSTLTFLFEKRLTYSDIKDEGRIVISKIIAEKYMPPLEAKEGFFMFMDDITEVKIWRFKYRFWPNNNRRVYVLEKTGEFVKSNQLRMGDFVIIYKDNPTQRFVIGMRKSTNAAPEQDGGLSSSLSVIVQGDGALKESNNQELPFLPPPAATIPETGGSNSSSYVDDFEDFPTDLLDDIEDLSEF